MERKTVSFSAKIKPIEKINDEFLKVKIYVCGLGKNRNMSHISRESADEALYSLYNIPIIGYLYEGEDGEMHMGSHEVKLVKDEDGRYKYKSLCVPYGVVPKQDDVHYEDVKEPNGNIVTYVVAYGILWVGRFSELLDAVYSEDWLFSQSMEINVSRYAPLQEDKNYMDLQKYSYSALCLLGRSDEEEYNYEPCFPESHVSVAYEVEKDAKFAELMEEFKKDLSKCFSNKNEGKEEEVKMTDEIRDAILAEYNLTIEDIDFEITNGMTEEELRDKLSAMSADEGDSATPSEPDEPAAADSSASEEGEPGGEGAPEGPEAEPESEKEFSSTYREKASALDNAMPNSKNVVYWVCDFDEKYVYVERTSFDENGDYTDEHGRFEYSYDEAERTATITSEFESMIVRWLTETESAQIDALRGQYEELKAYKEQREREDRENAFTAALKEFPELAGVEEYSKLSENLDSYESVEEIKNACYMIRGKYGISPKNHKISEPSVPVGAPKKEMTLREKMHEEFGRR